MSNQFSNYCKIIKLYEELTNDNSYNVRTKPLSDSVPLVQLSPKKRDIQNFYDSLSKEWFDGNDHLWNFTLNPDLRKVTVGQKKNPSDATVKQFLKKYIIKVLNNKNIRFAIKETVVYWEWGEKNNKFHCNVCIRADSKEDSRCYKYVLDKFKTIDFTCKFKDQRTFKLPDSYNCKDAAFMSKMGHAPLHVQAHSMVWCPVNKKYSDEY